MLVGGLALKLTSLFIKQRLNTTAAEDRGLYKVWIPKMTYLLGNVNVRKAQMDSKGWKYKIITFKADF